MGGGDDPHSDNTNAEGDPPATTGRVGPPNARNGLIAGAIMAFLAAGAAFGFWYSQPKGVRGSIILSSPTIYTRQRLVNDRLSQADWLAEQLKETERDKANNFQSVDAFSVRTTANEIKIAGNIGGAQSAKTAPDQSNEGAEKQGSTVQSQDYELKQTTLDKFIAMNMYRDTVRSELMHTLLDDRHDIAGNTIYRLGFDATVLGGRGSNQLAVIFVHIKHTAFTDNEIKNQNITTRSIEQIVTDEEYRSIYNEWIGSVRDNLIEANKSIMLLLSNGNEVPQFEQFLDTHICDLLSNDIDNNQSKAANHLDKSYDKCHRGVDEWASEVAVQDDASSLREIWLSLDTVVKVINKYNVNSIMTRVGGNVNSSTYGQLTTSDEFQRAESSCRDAPDKPYTIGGWNHALDGEPHLLKCPLNRHAWLVDEKIRLYYILRYFQDQLDDKSGQCLDYSCIKSVGSVLRPNTPLKLELGSSNDYVRLIKEIDTYIIEDYQGNPEYNFKSIGAIKDELIDQKEVIDTLKTSETEGSSGQAEMYLQPSLQQEALFVEDAMRHREECLVNDFLIWRNTDALGSDRLDGRRLDYYMEIRNDWSDTSRCTLIVSKPKGEEQPGFTGKHSWELLRNKLDENDEMFVYSVEPKNFAQRISTATQFKRTIDLGAAGRGALGGQTAEGAASWEEQQDRKLDEIENHALVLPLGEGASSLRDQGPHEISFGWAIAPRLRAGTGEAVHVDGTYALSAVISVPSWWRTVRADYHMCWIDSGDIDPDRLKGEGIQYEAWDSEHIESVCSKAVTHSGNPQNSQTEDNTDLIRLPHNLPEIYRKLGFDLLEKPYLTGQQQLTTLLAGYPGDLRLEGERLWRGTDVFLNSQKADRIMVLPDMKGIVAHFNCVLPALDPQSSNVVTNAVVTVVTSEGHAQLTVPVQLMPPPVGPIGQSNNRNSNAPASPNAHKGSPHPPTGVESASLRTNANNTGGSKYAADADVKLAPRDESGNIKGPDGKTAAWSARPPSSNNDEARAVGQGSERDQPPPDNPDAYPSRGNVQAMDGERHASDSNEDPQGTGQTQNSGDMSIVPAILKHCAVVAEKGWMGAMDYEKDYEKDMRDLADKDNVGAISEKQPNR